MDRSLQYLFGGVASTALIAGAIAAFISITALVADTSLPSGSSVQPPSGSQSVRIAEPAQPSAGPLAAGAPAGFAPTPSSPAAIRELATVGRALSGSPAHGGSPAADRNAPGRTGQGGAHHTSPGGSGGPSNPGGGNGSSPPLTDSTPSPAPSPGGAPPPTSGGGGPTSTPPSTGNGPSSTPPGLASKPGGLPPGLASKPGGTPPGLASKPSGTPPGLASKPGGLPPGQAKKQ